MWLGGKVSKCTGTTYKDKSMFLEGYSFILANAAKWGSVSSVKRQLQAIKCVPIDGVSIEFFDKHLAILSKDMFEVVSVANDDCTGW